MPRHCIGPTPMSPAERQARRQAAPAEPRSARAAAPARAPRPTRWAAAVAALVDLQEEYRVWSDNLPPNLETSSLADKLPTIVELDLEALQEISPPRGYGRD